MQRVRSLRPGSSPSCTIHRTSLSSASVAVTWEKLKGHNDAGEAVKSGQWSDQSVSKSAVPAAPVAEKSSSASASSLVSPLPSVVAAQTEFIKQTLRATYAHVSPLKPLFFMPSHRLIVTMFLVTMFLFQRYSGSRKIATVFGLSVTTACKAPAFPRCCRFVVTELTSFAGITQSASVTRSLMQ